MKNTYLIIVIFLCLAAFLPRVLSLDAFLSPDEPQWERNTQRFKEAIKRGDVKGIYQQPHPGITTQWISAIAIEASSWGAKRLPLAIVMSLTVLYAAYLLRGIIGTMPSIAAGFLLALNPLLIAHSRVLAMDASLSMFLLLAVITHILWVEKKNRRYAIESGVWTALAFLSKMAAFGIIGYFGVASILLIWIKKVSIQELLRGIIWWLIGFFVACIGLFPTIITNFPYVLEGSRQFFSTEHFTQMVHALGPYWYPQAFLLWTTPLQLLGLLFLPAALIRNNRYRLPLLLFALFSIIFFLEIQYSIKKGDRYMLPLFVMFDCITVASLAFTLEMIRNKVTSVTRNSFRNLIIGTTASILIIGTVWQLGTIIQLHPYELAYRNPFFRSLAKNRTMGWGEGLDIAAAYLNQKQNPEDMLVIAYYEGSFAQHFKGKVTSAERLAKESAESIGGRYVVLYRTMEGRAADRWETKVLHEYAQKTPEHIISINNEPYVWIYSVPSQ